MECLLCLRHGPEDSQYVEKEGDPSSVLSMPIISFRMQTEFKQPQQLQQSLSAVRESAVSVEGT